MIGDIWTIIWKEAKEILLQRGNLRGGWFGLLIFNGVLFLRCILMTTIVISSMVREAVREDGG